MKILRFSTLICVVTILLACQQQKSYTFVQYNVGAFSKYDGSSVDAVASAVKEMKADVVSLNELDSCTTRTGCVDQLAEFAAAMGDWNHQFGAAIPYKGGAYGVGVASSPSLEIIRTDAISLPKLDGQESRAVALVEYEDFVYCSTHLDLTEASQIGQVEAINHYMDSVYMESRKPIFLGGDFNCFPESKPVELLMKSWVLLSPVDFTFPSHAPDRCIDFIFMRPQGRKVTVELAEVPLSLETADLATASDHLPVLVNVVIE